jgi:Ubiquitin family
MWSQFELIIETLTGSEIEVTVSQTDTILCIKSKIQQFEGKPRTANHIPISNDYDRLHSTRVNKI